MALFERTEEIFEDENILHDDYQPQSLKERAYLPLEVDSERITLSGIIDLVHVTDDTVKNVDFKTDLSQHAESEYRIQLSVYYHVLEEWLSDHTVTASIFYTAEDVRVEIDPLSEAELAELARNLQHTTPR